MKRQTLGKKLTIIKTTIAHLDSEQMNNLKGGTLGTQLTYFCPNSVSLNNCDI